MKKTIKYTILLVALSSLAACQGYQPPGGGLSDGLYQHEQRQKQIK